MLHIKNLDEGLSIFKALGSEIRVKIIKILLENHGMSMNELASRLNITNGALTGHIKKLEDSGIVTTSTVSTGHRNLKKCSVFLDKILIDLDTREDFDNIYQTSLRIGHYTDYCIYPTCGIDQINISLETGSEAPGINDIWSSDISFKLNGRKIATWTSPGDFGAVQGIFTPDWWYPNWNQYGLLKILVINQTGTFIDGLQVSDVSINEFGFDHRSTIKLKLEVEEDAEYVGGLTIFGKNFGNYNQDIDIRMHYSPISGTPANQVSE